MALLNTLLVIGTLCSATQHRYPTRYNRTTTLIVIAVKRSTDNRPATRGLGYWLVMLVLDTLLESEA